MDSALNNIQWLICHITKLNRNSAQVQSHTQNILEKSALKVDIVYDLQTLTTAPDVKYTYF